MAKKTPLSHQRAVKKTPVSHQRVVNYATDESLEACVDGLGDLLRKLCVVESSEAEEGDTGVRGSPESDNADRSCKTAS